MPSSATPLSQAIIVCLPPIPLSITISCKNDGTTSDTPTAQVQPDVASNGVTNGNVTADLTTDLTEAASDIPAQDESANESSGPAAEQAHSACTSPFLPSSPCDQRAMVVSRKLPDDPETWSLRDLVSVSGDDKDDDDGAEPGPAHGPGELNLDYYNDNLDDVAAGTFRITGVFFHEEKCRLPRRVFPHADRQSARHDRGMAHPPPIRFWRQLWESAYDLSDPLAGSAFDKDKKGSCS